MILILTDDDEPTTDLVINWLHFFKKPFIRISCKNSIEIRSIYHDINGALECIFDYLSPNGICTLDTADIDSYWYRRSYLSSTVANIVIAQNDEQGTKKEIQKALKSHLYDESTQAIKILNYILNKKSKISRYDDNSILKIAILDSAKKIGLRTPKFIICDTKEQLRDFYFSCDKKIITKSIGDPTSLFHMGYHCYTNVVDFDKLPPKFGLSLFQEMIEKTFELRVFYVLDNFFGSAIFTQQNEKTKIDLKNHDINKPNRVVPYHIDEELAQKLRIFMNANNLNSGSIDLIVNKNNEYVFLEVNPVGQFEQVEVPCNYGIFKYIAKSL